MSGNRIEILKAALGNATEVGDPKLVVFPDSKNGYQLTMTFVLTSDEAAALAEHAASMFSVASTYRPES